MKISKAHEGDKPFMEDVPMVEEHDVNMGHQVMKAPVIVLGGHNRGNGSSKSTQSVNE